MERRKQVRKNFYAPVDFTIKGTLYKEVSRDISDFGIYLYSNYVKKYKIDNIAIITFQNSDGLPEKLKGKIVRKDDKGVGIQFIVQMADRSSRGSFALKNN